jgi:CheY-like chemotaxis protein
MRVLVVDTDVGVRAAVRGMLEEAGFQVAEAGNGDEGIRAFRRQPADVVLTDLFMPDRNGLEMIRDLRRQFPGVKVIATSGGWGRVRLDVLPLARALGAARVLYKPFKPSEVREALDKVGLGMARVG